jgi:hypothetical protein
MKIIVQPTELAHWHAVVNEAQVAVDCQLEESVESYLVYLLMRFNTFAALSDSVLAKDFFKASQASGRHRVEILQGLGDKSLIFSGFFPEQAEQRNVKLNYFIDMGKSAYQSVALFKENEKALFLALSDGFVSMITVLNLVKGNVPVTLQKN